MTNDTDRLNEIRERFKGADELAKDYPKLAKAVDWFTSEMRAKLLAKADQGYEGWDDPEYITGQWRDQTLGHVIRLMLDGDAGQAVDVANLAMFYAAFRKAQEDAK